MWLRRLSLEEDVSRPGRQMLSGQISGLVGTGKFFKAPRGPREITGEGIKERVFAAVLSQPLVQPSKNS